MRSHITNWLVCVLLAFAFEAQAECGYVTHPVSAATAKYQFSSLKGVYVAVGFVDVKRSDGKVAMGRDAIRITDAGVQIGYAISNNIFQPTVDEFDVKLDYPFQSSRFSGAIGAVSGTYILELEREGLCRSVAIGSLGRRDKLFRSAFLTTNSVRTDLNSIQLGGMEFMRVK